MNVLLENIRLIIGVLALFAFSYVLFASGSYLVSLLCFFTGVIVIYVLMVSSKK